MKLLEAIRRLVEIKLEGEELSDRPEVEAFISAARDYVERAISGGLTEKQAWQAMHKLLLKASDQIDRERRSRFTVVK